MPLPESPLSQTCRAIAGRLAQRLGALVNNIDVRLGSPAEAAPKDVDSKHRVNLFFYRFEPNGFGPAADPDEPWRLRLHCLITAFGIEDDFSPGENDLRLLGGVLRTFHEEPVVELDGVVVEGAKLRLQVVFQPLGVDEINHIWATQGEAAYRPSVAYEMALVPVMPQTLAIGGPLVGALGFAVRADEAGRRAPFTGIASPPALRKVAVDEGREDWAPRICFVLAGVCAESVSFALGSPELLAFAPRVWVVGSPGSKVTLLWEVWDGSPAGWRPEGDQVPATAGAGPLDPEAPPAPADTAEVSLPLAVPGQAVLYAEREYTRGSDSAKLLVRSNPLLVNLYTEAPP